MSLNRRGFLARASTAIVGSTVAVPRIFAQAGRRAARDASQRVLVVIQLSGGNDGLNTVIPHGDDAYHRNRFATRVEPSAVLRIDDHIGWHPGLRGFANLQQSGKLCVVQGVGYPNPNRSHFESMDIWHSARLTPPQQTGWIGRWFDEAKRQAPDSIPGVHLGDEPLPLAMSGLHVMVPSLKTIESLRVADDEAVRAALSDADPDIQSKDDLLGHLRRARETALAASRRLESLDSANHTSRGYPASDLARKLAFITNLLAIEFGPRVYYVTLGSFDTHSQQAAAHAALLSELGGAIEAFYGDLHSMGRADDVLTMCFSEFGRRVKENGSAGTDHGTAAPLFLAGTGLPPLIGAHPSLTDLVDGDLKFEIDFRSVYATLMDQWLRIDSAGILGEPFDQLPIFT